MRKKLIVLLFGDIVIILICIVALYIKIGSLNMIFILATIIWLYMICTWTYIYKIILNYFTLFLGISYAYYFGQYFLIFWGIKSNRQYNLHNVFSYTEINHAAIYLILNTLILHLFVCFFTIRGEKIKINFKVPKIDVTIFRKVFFLIFIVSGICEINILIYRITIYRARGYLIALNSIYNAAGGFSYIVRFIATLFIPAVFACLITMKGRKSNYIIWIGYGVYLLLYFMSGSRFEAVISLLGIFLLLDNYYKKINLKTFILFSLFGIGIIFVCSYISNIRIFMGQGVTNNFGELVKRGLNRTVENNIIYDAISVTGQTVLVATTIMKKCPACMPYAYGTYYLKGALRVIPNFTGGNNILITDSMDKIFTPFFTKSYGMGSSFIMEAYYNFGYLGMLVMIIYGWLIAILCREMKKIRAKNGDETGHVVKEYFIFYIASISFFYIRSDARLLFREIVFYYFSIYMLFVVIQKVARK